jgi:microcystin-dependent protein
MDPFVAEIRIFPFNFAPKGWAWCNGQLLPISQNTALFSLLGTTYGGDGKSTFALPDMQGNVAVHTGAAQPGPGLSTYFLGQTGGSETVTLLVSEMPSHSHTVQAQNTVGNRTSAVANAFARASAGQPYIPGSPTPTLVNMASQGLPPAGGDQPHNNMQPYLTLFYNIALQGVFPPRT